MVSKGVELTTAVGLHKKAISIQTVSHSVNITPFTLRTHKPSVQLLKILKLFWENTDSQDNSRLKNHCKVSNLWKNSKHLLPESCEFILSLLTTPHSTSSLKEQMGFSWIFRPFPGILTGPRPPPAGSCSHTRVSNWREFCLPGKGFCRKY